MSVLSDGNLFQNNKTCLIKMVDNVYAHEWIIEDNIDKKYISDNLSQS